MSTLRLIAPAAASVVGLAVYPIATHLGPVLGTVAWEGPAIGAAIGLLVLQRDVAREDVRQLLRLLAGFACLTAAGVGFHALWNVATYLFSKGQAAGATSIAQWIATESTLAASTWQAHRPSILFWTACAILPALAALSLCVPLFIGWFAAERDVAHGPWGAGWMKPVDANRLARATIGLPLGKLGQRIVRALVGAGHHMVIAGTRAGKSVSAVLPAIVDHEGPVFVIDLKGELFAVTRRYRESIGQRVIVLNPAGVNEQSEDTFNPLDYVRRDPAHIARDCDQIADGLFKPEGPHGQHFVDMARKLVSAAIEVVVTHDDEGNRNLGRVGDMLSNDQFVTTMTGWRDHPEVVGHSASLMAAAILRAGTNELGSIMSTVSKAFDWAASAPMRTFLSKSSFSLDQLLDGNADVFLVVPVDQLQSQSVFLRLMANIVLGLVMRNSGIRNLPRPLLMVLDEFVRLGRMDALVNIATVGAGPGIEALFVAQDIAQIEGAYGPEAHTLMAACATVRVWGLGRTDTKTAERIVAALGDKTVSTHSRHLRGKKRPTASEQPAKLLSVDRLLELPLDRMIVLLRGMRPLMLKRIISHHDNRYRSKLDRNPTLRSPVNEKT